MGDGAWGMHLPISAEQLAHQQDLIVPRPTREREELHRLQRRERRRAARSDFGDRQLAFGRVGVICAGDHEHLQPGERRGVLRHLGDERRAGRVLAGPLEATLGEREPREARVVLEGLDQRRDLT